MLIINNQEDMDNLNINSIQNVDEIKISNVSVIPEGKFYGLNKLTKVYMNNINIIESGAFMDCKNLKNVSFKNNPKEIQDFAFHNTNISFIPELYQDTKFGVYNNLGKNIKLENISWSDINRLSKLGKSSDYFNIGDMKSITLANGEIYNAEIIGFNHDNLADGSTAGITFQFKECITATCMNLRSTNVGGWETSEMSRYLNKDIYELLSADLQAEIKEVGKISDIGNKNTTDKVTTTDKLFLLSLEEVGLSYSYNVTGQGEKYTYYNNNASRIKFYLNGLTANWWLRSANTSTINTFFSVYYDGSYSYDDANSPYGAAPAFCI